MCKNYIEQISTFSFFLILPLHAHAISTVCLSKLAALAPTVACLPLVQQVRGSIPGGVVNFNLKIFNLEARRGGDVNFLIASLYITVLD